MLAFIVDQRLERLILLLVRQRKPNIALVGELFDLHFAVAPSRNVLLQIASIYCCFSLDWLQMILHVDSCILEQDFYGRISKLLPDSTCIHHACYFVSEVFYAAIRICLVTRAQSEIKKLVKIGVPIAKYLDRLPMLVQVEAHKRNRRLF